MKRTIPVIPLCLVLCLALSACGHVDLQMTDPTKVYRDAPVDRSELQMHVRPIEKRAEPVRALMLPFWITQEISDQQFLGQQVGEVFQQEWLSKRLFQTLDYDTSKTYRSAAGAVAMGRRMGADVVIVGFVPYLYAGHTLDDSAVTIEVRIYETKHGRLIADMSQGARVEKQPPRDFVYFHQETRMSDASLAMAIRAIASDMAVPLASWLPTPEEVMGFAHDSRTIVQKMTHPAPIPVPDNAEVVPAPADPPPARVAETDLGSAPMPPATPVDSPVVQREIDSLRSAQLGSANLNIDFASGSATPTRNSYPLLDELGHALTGPELAGRKIVIRGHTDSDADAASNKRLSLARAEAVKSYLTTHFGVNPALVRTEGLGETNPVAPNDTPENKRLNRRVEVALDH